MARNEHFLDADHLSLPVPAGTASGTPVIVGGIVGYAKTAEGEGGNAAGFASVWCKGAAKVSVSGAVASVGLKIYIPAGGGGLTTSADTGGTTPVPHVLWGYALATKGTGTGVIPVKIAQV